VSLYLKTTTTKKKQSNNGVNHKLSWAFI